MAGLTCEVEGLNIEIPDLRPGGTRLNLTPGYFVRGNKRVKRVKDRACDFDVIFTSQTQTC